MPRRSAWRMSSVFIACIALCGLAILAPFAEVTAEEAKNKRPRLLLLPILPLVCSLGGLGWAALRGAPSRDALSRIETMVLMAGLELPSRAIRDQIVSAIEYVVFVRRFEDGVRRVDCVAEATILA